MPDLPIRFNPARVFEFRRRMLPEDLAWEEAAELPAASEEPMAKVALVGLALIVFHFYAEIEMWLPGAGPPYSTEQHTGLALFVSQLPIAHALGLLSLIGIIFYTSTYAARFYFTGYQTWLLAAFVFWVLLTVPFSAAGRESLMYWFGTVLKLLGLFIVTINAVRNIRSLRTLLWVIILCGCMPAVGTILSWIFPPTGHVQRTGGRPGWLGNFWDPNCVAYFMAMLMSIGLYLFESSKKTGKIIVVCLFGLFGFTAMITLSRAGMMALAAVFGTHFLTSKRKWLSLLVGAVVLIAIIPKIPGVVSRAETIIEYKQDLSAMSRLHLWRAGLTMAKEHPIFGVGVSAFHTISGWYVKQPRRVPWRGPHSSYMGVLAETGFIGLGLFLALHLVTIRDAWRLYRRTARMDDATCRQLSRISRALIIALAGVCTVHLTLDRAYEYQLYIFIALVVCVKQIAARAGVRVDAVT